MRAAGIRAPAEQVDGDLRSAWFEMQSTSWWGNRSPRKELSLGVSFLTWSSSLPHSGNCLGEYNVPLELGNSAGSLPHGGK